MQASSSTNPVSLLSSHLKDSNPQYQASPDEKHDPDATISFPPTLPPPKVPSRSTKRHNNASTKSQKAAQFAKQELRSKLREDWSWPPAPSTPCSHQVLNLPVDESAWQERENGFETDLSPEETMSVDPYQYDNPDAVAAPARTTWSVESKKRKRRQMLLEEIRWNEGLKHFVERRDAWSGAREHKIDPPTATRSGKASSVSCGGGAGDRDVTCKRKAIYAHSEIMRNFKEEPFERLINLPTLQPPSDPSLSIALVPIGPPILPADNVVRASITPATYPSIYSKIVIQGLTPTMPINLNDVVGALVKGWKDNDEWPPKTDAERLATVKDADDLEGLGESMSNGMKKGVQRRVGKVKRVLHLSGTVEANDGNRNVGVDEAPNGLRQSNSRHGR